MTPLPIAVNPHAAQPTSLNAAALSFWRHRQLIWQMTRREVQGRYRGSVLGLLWSLLNTLFMSAVYTLVLSVEFTLWILPLLHKKTYDLQHA